MEVVRAYETLVSFYQTTRCDIQEDNILRDEIISCEVEIN
jgi:hypothetical protein